MLAAREATADEDRAQNSDRWVLAPGRAMAGIGESAVLGAEARVSLTSLRTRSM
jgi:hypothetical protein